MCPIQYQSLLVSEIINLIHHEKTEDLEDKHPNSICPPKIQNKLNRTRTQAQAVTGCG
jgi:hypothetical protein